METCVGEMQNAQRAAGQRQALMRASNASSREQRLYAEHTGDALPFHSRPRQLSELV
jgi:acyl dehydratase